MNARARIFAVLFAIAAGAIGACSLNPQPIPPGLQDNGAGTEPAPSADASTDKATSDSGGNVGQFADAATPRDAGGTIADAEPPGPLVDAGEDADADAAADAESDADASDGAPE